MGRQARIWTAAVGLAATLVFGCAAPTPAPSAAHSAALTTEPAHAAAAAQIIEEAMEADHIPAMSVAVMRDGALVWSEAFGLANLETGEPADRESKFRIGSVSKLFTADLAAILAEEGGRSRRGYPDLPSAVSRQRGADHLAPAPRPPRRRPSL